MSIFFPHGKKTRAVQPNSLKYHEGSGWVLGARSPCIIAGTKEAVV